MSWEIPKTRLGPPLFSDGGDPCPALPICDLVGNARKGCSNTLGMPPHVCIAGLILLTARGQGLYTAEMEDALQQRRQIGFVQPPDEASE